MVRSLNLFSCLREFHRVTRYLAFFSTYTLIRLVDLFKVGLTFLVLRLSEGL